MNQNSWKRVCETPTVMVVACVEPWCETYSVSLLHELVRAAVFAPCFVFSEDLCWLRECLSNIPRNESLVVRETLPRDYPNVDIRPVVYACVRGAWKSVATVADVRALAEEETMNDEEDDEEYYDSESD